jgi:hypothetical protein
MSDESQRAGSRRRGRKPGPDSERKDRVIQARVPQDLENTLKDVADSKRVTVSQLVRNVLEDTFVLVDHLVADSAQLVSSVRKDSRRIAQSARGQADKPAASATATPLDAVDAWQDVIVNRPGSCAQCGAALRRGQRAFRGLSTDSSLPPVWLCGTCIEKL